MSKITIITEGKGSKSSIVITKDSIVCKVENEEMEKPNFELGSIEGAEIKIEENSEMYIKGGIKISELISRVSNAESAITQIVTKLGEDNK